MEHINLLVSIISIVSAVSSFVFYIAARQIKADTQFSIRELTTKVDGKFERLEINLSSRFQRCIDRNSSRITNAEARLEYIESAFDDPDYNQFISTLHKGLPDEHTDL
ncbi:hypothetical protein [Microcoleus sp. Pol10D4]|uniref:hypothetical protein n=1 Tax=Microcoleus sp. Pol10D4 TaxID=3055387 RepID=UPI002FCF5580